MASDLMADRDHRYSAMSSMMVRMAVHDFPGGLNSDEIRAAAREVAEMSDDYLDGLRDGLDCSLDRMGT